MDSRKNICERGEIYGCRHKFSHYALLKCWENGKKIMHPITSFSMSIISMKVIPTFDCYKRMRRLLIGKSTRLY